MTLQRGGRIVHKYQPWVPADRRDGSDVSPTYTHFLTDSRMHGVVHDLLALGWEFEGIFDLLLWISVAFDHHSGALSSWEVLTNSERAAAAKGIGSACRELALGLRSLGSAARGAAGKLRLEGEYRAAELLASLSGLTVDEDDDDGSAMSAAREALLAIARSSEDWPNCFHTGTGRNDETKLLRIAVVVVADSLEPHKVRSWARLSSTIASVMVPGTIEPGERAVRRIVQASRSSGHENPENQK